MDKFEPHVRSRIMSGIRRSRTSPELKIKEKLIGSYLRYQPKKLPGNPDFASKSRKIAVFVDGCFWHKCPECFREPKSNKQYWLPKIRRNMERDRRNNALLKNDGWTIARVWEHEINSDIKKATKKILTKLGK